MDDRFQTIKSLSTGYYIDRGSKFHTYAAPVYNELEVSQFLQGIKKDHPKARHYCYGLRLFPDASVERSNDDGEPSGSAGRPILGQLIKHSLTNVIIVVVRYFGGTKLGVPGLIESYKTSAANALDNSIMMERNIFSKVRVEMSYDIQPQFLNYCKMTEIPVLYEEFGEKASMILLFKKSSVHEELKDALHDFSQMDFKDLNDYLKHLNMKIEYLPGDQIL